MLVEKGRLGEDINGDDEEKKRSQMACARLGCGSSKISSEGIARNLVMNKIRQVACTHFVTHFMNNEFQIPHFTAHSVLDVGHEVLNRCQTQHSSCKFVPLESH